jgi:uncharacterized coiled-coil DUF342 family protein
MEGEPKTSIEKESDSRIKEILEISQKVTAVSEQIDGLELDITDYQNRQNRDLKSSIISGNLLEREYFSKGELDEDKFQNYLEEINEMGCGQYDEYSAKIDERYDEINELRKQARELLTRRSEIVKKLQEENKQKRKDGK